MTGTPAPGLAALAQWPVEVDVAGMRVTIPARPALTWITALVTRDLVGVVPGMVDTDTAGHLMDALATGRVNVGDCVDAAKHAVDAAAGMRWWRAARLVHVAIGSDQVAGAMAVAGVDAGRMSLGGWCCAVYRTLVENLGRTERGKVDMQLDMPPAGVRAVELYDPQAAAAAFDGVPG